MNLPTEFNFSIVRKSIPVTLTDENGNARKVSLMEFDGLTRDKYMAFIQTRFMRDGAEDTGARQDISGVQATLLSLCLVDENKQAIPADEIQTWPVLVQTELFKAAQKLNGLAKDSEGDAKNV